MARITAIQDRSVIDTDIISSIMRKPFDVTDTFLCGGYLQGVKERCDSYCENEFLDDDGVETAIPMAIETFIVRETVRLMMNVVNGTTKNELGEISISIDAEFHEEEMLKALFPYHTIREV